LSLAIVVLFVQRQLLIHLNHKKEKTWNTMSPEEKIAYQTNQEDREKDGNKRLDFKFAF